MSPTTPAELRERLARIDHELQALPADAFAAKHELLTEADQHRNLLSDHVGPDLEAAGKEWADRAGRKGAHTQDTKALQARINIGNDLGGGGSGAV